MSNNPAAIITGSNRGIGKGIALAIAELGYDIAINHTPHPADHPSAIAGEETRRHIEGLGVRCEIIQADISRPEEQQHAYHAMMELFGRCDLLVNNAGVAPLQRLDILEATEESFDRVLNINLKGPYFLTQIFANWMIKQKQANPERTPRIVNIGSISTYASSPSRGEYCISKAGIGMMTSLFADRLAEYGIGVFEVRPGITATDMTSTVKDKYDKLIEDGLTPIKRWGQPEDIGRAVAAIAEGRLDFCTGQVINADGGFHLRRL